MTARDSMDHSEWGQHQLPDQLYHHFFQFLYYETKILVLTNWRFDAILNVVYQTHLSNSADLTKHFKQNIYNYI